MTNGAIAKVRVYAYTDKFMNIPNEAVPQPFYLPVNPESYSKNFKIETDNRRGHGSEGTDPRYNSTAPEELKLDFIFDGTDTIENYRYTNPSAKSVKEQLALFMKTVYQMDGTIHRPNFLRVHWGECLVFPCILSNMDVSYQLFGSDGDPLRVKISASFLKYITPEERNARAHLCSPDLTHLRLAKAGDRLDLMTHKIYNDTKYMLQVARVNNLVSLRVLKPGKEMRFPPLDKTEKA